MTDIKDFIDNSELKLNKLMKEWIGPLDMDSYTDKTQFDVKYVNGEKTAKSSDRSLFSGSILRHIDAGKCLYSRLYNNIPKKADKRNYTSVFFKADELVMSEFSIDTVKEVTFYLDRSNEKLQAVFFVRNNENNQPQRYINPLDIYDLANGSKPQQKHFYSFDYSVYDDKNRLVSNELYEKQYGFPYGVTVTGEYYEYSGEKLIYAVKYRNYNENYYNDCTLIQPGVFFNPEIYYYDFEYTDDAVFCSMTRKYSPNEDHSKRFEPDISELRKLSKYGVRCFGV